MGVRCWGGPVVGQVLGQVLGPVLGQVLGRGTWGLGVRVDMGA